MGGGSGNVSARARAGDPCCGSKDTHLGWIGDLGQGFVGVPQPQEMKEEAKLPGRQGPLVTCALHLPPALPLVVTVLCFRFIMQSPQGVTKCLRSRFGYDGPQIVQ